MYLYSKALIEKTLELRLGVSNKFGRETSRLVQEALGYLDAMVAQDLPLGRLLHTTRAVLEEYQENVGVFADSHKRFELELHPLRERIQQLDSRLRILVDFNVVTSDWSTLPSDIKEPEMRHLNIKAYLVGALNYTKALMAYIEGFANPWVDAMIHTLDKILGRKLELKFRRVHEAIPHNWPDSWVWPEGDGLYLGVALGPMVALFQAITAELPREKQEIESKMKEMPEDEMAQWWNYEMMRAKKKTAEWLHNLSRLGRENSHILAGIESMAIERYEPLIANMTDALSQLERIAGKRG